MLSLKLNYKIVASYIDKSEQSKYNVQETELKWWATERERQRVFLVVNLMATGTLKEKKKNNNNTKAQSFLRLN